MEKGEFEMLREDRIIGRVDTHLLAHRPKLSFLISITFNLNRAYPYT